MSHAQQRERAARLLDRLCEDDVLKMIAGRLPYMGEAEIRDLLHIAAALVRPNDGRNLDEATINVDGASIGNPGPAGAGAVILDAHNKKVAAFSEHLGMTTNNVAEYRALILGLSKARELGVRRIHIRADSELMVRQMTGAYRIKDEKLQALSREAMEILDSFDSFDIQHVDRNQNRDADRLAKRAAESPDQ